MGEGETVLLLWHVPVLFVAGLAAGWVDSIAGGGGLITVPALLSVGLPPQLALGTNKLQACFGSGTAAYSYWRGGAVLPRRLGWGIGLTALGAAAGTLTVQHLSHAALAAVIPFLLLGVAVYTLVSPRIGDATARPRIGLLPLYLLAGPLIGCYDGFFGPGTGSFWVIALVAGAGLPLVQATGTTKVMNFTSNVVALGFFLAGGHVLLGVGLVMAVGELIGARIGARMALARGARFIRPVLVAVCCALTVKLLWR